MIWLILSVLCSTLIFIIFRLFSPRGIDNLQAIILNYYSAFLTGVLVEGNIYGRPLHVKPEWYWSILLMGALFIVLFQIMAHVAQKMGLAVVSVSVKMSLIIPVSFGIFHFSESAGFFKILGILMALAAVFIVTRGPVRTDSSRGVALAFVLFLGGGLIDAFLKYSQVYLLQPGEMGFFASTIFLMAGIFGTLLFLIKLIRGQSKVSPRSLLWGIVLGIPNYGSIYFLLRALDTAGQESSAVFPINNVGVVALSALSGVLLFGENLNRNRLFGILLAILSIILIALNS